jgi:predicted DNA-binding transcriptional regulator YafY
MPESVRRIRVGREVVAVRAARLLSVLLVLQTEGRVTARELARRLEVSERTVLRDLDELSATGVPVYAIRGPHGGFELLDTFRQSVPAVPGGAAVTTAQGRIRRVRVRISPPALQRALVVGAPEGWRPRSAPDSSVEHPEWIEGSFRFMSDDDALRELQALAPEVEVLLPLDLRARMCDTGRRIAEQHVGPPA